MGGKLKEIEYRLTMKDMPAACRPRERMLFQGAGALSNAELLAIILRTGSMRDTALDLAHKLLGQGGLKFLVEASPQELIQFTGVGAAKAAQIKAAIELCRRIASTEEIRPFVRSPHDVSHIMQEEMRFLDREHFKALFLNTKNQLIQVVTVSIGSLDSSLVHPRELFKDAVKASAAAIILVHNHPSGDTAPSREDVDVTKRLSQAGKIMGIEILDHIIFGKGSWISLKEKGLMEE